MLYALSPRYELSSRQSFTMIVVFVIDTSPSMGQPLSETSEPGGGMSRLDLAKMAVEDIVRGLNKRVSEHNVYLQHNPQKQNSLRNIGLGFTPNDQFLLLSTGRQHSQQPATAACGAGGRLLVGYGDASREQTSENPGDQSTAYASNANSFQKSLKCLRATEWDQNRTDAKTKKPVPFPADGGGSIGLNAALSVGLQMLSRYRLMFRSTENYGMGRLPSQAVLSPSGGGPAVHALQPACLILITDGACLHSQPSEGGGSLQLQYGKMPLRDFYQEPFRWDQRIFCLGVGGKDDVDSTSFLHPQLRSLCEVTGGSHSMLRSSSTLATSTAELVRQIAPPRPSQLPVPDPLRLQSSHSPLVGATGTFVNGGPVCSFQALEGDLDTSQPAHRHRALLLYTPHEQAGLNDDSRQEATFHPPMWCIPENHFPKKTLDVLPPRSAQPNLLFSIFPSRLGSKSFEPEQVLRDLSRLDQLVFSNRKHSTQLGTPIKLLHRDVYICEWIPTDGNTASGPQIPMSMAYFPVVAPGAARQIADGESAFLNIGVLHVPSGTSTLGKNLQSGVRVSTLTLLPPEPHILLPLLIRAAEAEHKALKKIAASDAGNSSVGILKRQAIASRNVHLDEHWRSEFHAYFFRIPPYYQTALRRCLRVVLPSSAHSLLNAEGSEGALGSLCFSKACLQKLRNAEQMAKESNERLERQEAELRRRGTQQFGARNETQQNNANQRRQQNDHSNEQPKIVQVGYGQYDARSSTESYLAALRGMPAPWRVFKPNDHGNARLSESRNELSDQTLKVCENASQAIGDIPASCLMAYYESRRRWIFGGSGLTTRGLFVEGVPNDGSNVQRIAAKHDVMDESLLSLAGVGASQVNATTTAKMGDYRERLLWSRAPVVGCGSNDSTGVSATTGVDGGPKWSVDDDAMPVAFFNPSTGEFTDSVQARMRSRLMVNFGNPYKDRRADSLVPQGYLNQHPSSKKGSTGESEGSPLTPPGSPPHDTTYSASEGEGEAVFANPLSRIRKSPSRNEQDDPAGGIPDGKRQKSGLEGAKNSIEIPKKQSDGASAQKMDKNAPNPPPPRPPPKKALSDGARPPQRPIERNSKVRPPGPPAPPSKAPPPPKPAPKKTPIPERPPAPPAKPNPPPKPAVHKRTTSTGSTSAASSAQTSGSSSIAVGKRVPTAPVQEEQLDMQTPDKRPGVDLPQGWMTVWSKSQKRWYFFCTKTNKSVWQWPPPT